MTKAFNDFLKKKCNAWEENMHELDACNEYIERYEAELADSTCLPEEVHEVVKAAFVQEIQAAQELKDKILSSLLFWDKAEGREPGEEYLTLKVVPVGDLEDMRLHFHGCRVEEGYIYKNEICKRTDWSSGFACVYITKKLVRTKITDLPEVDHNLLEEIGANIDLWDLDDEYSKVVFPEWEEVSTEEIGHEYPGLD